MTYTITERRVLYYVYSREEGSLNNVFPFSKVLAIVNFHSKYTRVLNFCAFASKYAHVTTR